MKKFMGNIILLVISTTLCVVVLEIGLRIFAPQIVVCKINYEWRQDDNVLPYVPKENYTGNMILKDQFDAALTTNSHGFRGRSELAIEKSDGVKRIAFIGDSFTFGWGVDDDEVFVSLFEEKFKGSGKEIETINAAVYGYDIVQYREVFDRLIKYNPDVIFLGFCLENDFNITPLKGSGSADKSIRVERMGMASRVRNIINNMHIVAMIRDRLYITFPKIRNFMLSAGINNKRDIFLEEYTSVLTASLNKTEKIIVSMKNEAEARGIEFCIILIPLKEQIYCREEINRFPGYDIDRPNHVMEDMLKRLGVEYVDLLPLLVKERERSSKRLYFDIDPHWTAYGHERVSEILYNACKKRGYLL